MAPVPHRVVSRTRETHDTWTLELDSLGERVVPSPGQFSMLYAHGIGEIPISASGEPRPGGPLVHTIRAVGAVSEALSAMEPGAVIGVRGPFGTIWPLEEARGGDLVIVAGGIGLAPLRPAILHALAHRDDYGAVCVVVGARTPDDLLYAAQLDAWAAFDLDVGVTVDAAGRDWHGRVGLVTKLIPDAPFEPARATAFVVGPEMMMRFTARALIERGVPEGRIHVSAERSMACGVGHCGHCQLGPVLVCRDGPVLRYAAVRALMEVREL